MFGNNKVDEGVKTWALIAGDGFPTLPVYKERGQPKPINIGSTPTTSSGSVLSSPMDCLYIDHAFG